MQLLSVGEATLDVFILPSEYEQLCQVKNQESLVCFSYGDKIPVKSLEFSIGGNAANNAIGTRRLGIESSAVLTLGDDEVADRIITRLTQENVDITFVHKQQNTTSNYSTVIMYGGERTIFTHNTPKTYIFPHDLPEKVAWIYLTSMGDTFEPFYVSLVEFLKLNPQIKLAFNPGSRQIRAGVEKIMNVLKRTDLLFVNREEAEKISGFSDSKQKEKELLQKLTEMGVKRPIVTDGVVGSYAFDGEYYLNCGVLPIDPYERTGAGDAFGSGTLSAIIKGKELSEALIWGSVNSASVIGYTGSQRGLLHEDEMEVWLKRAESVGLKTVKI